MKKTLLIVAAAISIAACKKTENVETTATMADSAQSVGAANASVADSTGKIQILEDEKKSHSEEFKKSLPKINSAVVISGKKGLEKSEDSIQKKVAVPSVKVVMAPEKIIRERKIVYKSPAKTTQPATKEMKNADLEFSTENLGKALQNVRNISENYGGKIVSEKKISTGEMQTSSLEISVPAAEFSNIVNALEFGEVGNIDSKNIQNVGSNEKALVSLSINSQRNVPAGNQDGFGGRTLAAISAGGSAIGSIFLFLLPFWPLFLVGIIAAYFYKKRKKGERAE